MSQRSKAALIALGVIVALTVVKYILYRISGSAAVLSEAVHSTTDITTTLLVVISIFHQEWKTRNGKTKPTEEYSPATGKFALLRRIWRRFAETPSELHISIVISIILSLVALGILRQAIMGGVQEITLPLITGIIFIGLSFGSFFLYRFEENIGTSENSPALKADSQHNRADMGISLMTGVSLILYYFGYNVDRYVSFLIAAFILVFTIELLVNTIRSIWFRRDSVEIEYHFTSIVLRIFDIGMYRALVAKLGERFGTVDVVRRGLHLIPRVVRWILLWSKRAILAAGIVAYLSTGFYVVAPQEKGLLLRFGRLVGDGKPVEPGLHLKFPYPIDKVIRFETETVRDLFVGNATQRDVAMIWSKEHGDNQTFISADNNLFLPYVIIHYRIKDIHQYYLNNRNETPEKLIGSLAYRLLTQVFVSTSFYDLILNDRDSWVNNCHKRLQQESDKLKTGIEITEICVKDLHPPTSLAGAYEEVVAARQFREKFLNDAQRQVVNLLTRERMQALKTVNEAKSYVVDKKSLAQGEAQNYLLRYSGYQHGGGVMKDLLLLQTAEKTLKGKELILVDPKSGIDQELIYIENYLTGQK